MQSHQPNTPDDFDEVLRDLVRAPSPQEGFAAGLAGQPTHPLDDALQRVAGEMQAYVAEPQPGDVLDGRYRVEEVLGRGGMGVVLGAEGVRTGKRVAIKWMSAGAGGQRSQGAVARFLREARAVATIQHPNVVDLYDVGDSEGIPFLVLERLQGESLRVRMSRGPLFWGDARQVMLGVLKGVCAVHGAGIVHRDLKPDNIFLCRAGEGAEPPVPKVLDFGVAAVRHSDRPESHLTRTGALLGTPSYMSLEQLTNRDVDVRSDVYALGVVFYEMLSGSLPFVARSAAELAVLQATTEPARLQRLVPTLGRGRESVVMRALARKPGDRYADAASFIAALEACDGAEWGSSWRRRALLVGLTSLVAAAGVFGVHAFDRAHRVEAGGSAREQHVGSARSALPVTPMAEALKSAIHASKDLRAPEEVFGANTNAPSVSAAVEPSLPTASVAAGGAAREEGATRASKAPSKAAVRKAAPAAKPLPSPGNLPIAPERAETRINVEDF